MKRNLLFPFMCMGAIYLSASLVWAEGWTPQEYSKLSISEQQFEACKKQTEPDYADIRTAISSKKYAVALKLIGKPSKSSPAEINYLYGKTLYLIAHQQANDTVSSQPQQGELAEAKKYIDLAAQQGSLEAIYDQAILFTAPEDVATKLALLKQAADKQFVPAMLTLAEHYFYATKTFEERTEAQSLIQTAANIDSQAKVVLASYYLHEDSLLKNLAGYDKDINKAIALLHVAATECNGVAAYKLYQMSDSEHKPNDLPVDRALYWLEASAKLGYAKAQGDIAEYYFNEKKDGEKAVYWAKQAIDSKDVKALMTLGKIYYHGVDMEKDHSKALHFYEQAFSVDKDNRLVLNQLGMMYYKGEGSEVDFSKAARFCERAANKGQAGCQYYLGLMYVNGEGVTQDIDTGISWMKKSAAQDFTVAKNWLRENW